MNESLYMQCYECGALCEFKGDGYKCSCGGGLNVMVGKPDDQVNHPSHYMGKIECIDAIETAIDGLNGFEGYCTGNIIKYIWRWKKKNGLEDLKKAKWYLERLIKVVEAMEQ